MISAQRAMPLGFSTNAAFWTQVNVYVHDCLGLPPLLPDQLGQVDIGSLDALSAFQATVYKESGGQSDLSDSLAWQRQYHLLGSRPFVLSKTSELGRFHKLLPAHQEILLQLPNTTKAADAALWGSASKVFPGISRVGLLRMALKFGYHNALLHCDYGTASVSAIGAFQTEQQQSRGRGGISDELEEQLAIQMMYAVSADELSKNNLSSAAHLIGEGLITFDTFSESRLLEIGAWFTDCLGPLKGRTYSQLKDEVLLPWQQVLPDEQFPYALQAIGLAIGIADPENHAHLWDLIERDFFAN